MAKVFDILLMPIAWLPLKVLYALGRLLLPWVEYVFRYRRKVIEENLHKSFPEKGEKEIKRLRHKYYCHVCDLLAEAIWGLRAKPKQLFEHYRVTNRQLLSPYFEEGRSVILMSAHYNNWEMMIASLNFQFLHHGVGVGKPVEQKHFGEWLTAKRARYGTEIVDQRDVRQVMDFYDRYKVPVAYMMLGDQSPSNPHKSYWTTFLNQDTAFLFGGEHFAKKYGYPVIFYRVKKVKRGYYEITLEELSTNPQEEKEYAITQRYTERVEQMIKEEPERWLWSHRRWKLTHNGRILKDGTIKPIPNRAV